MKKGKGYFFWLGQTHGTQGRWPTVKSIVTKGWPEWAVRAMRKPHLSVIDCGPRGKELVVLWKPDDITEAEILLWDKAQAFAFQFNYLRTMHKMLGYPPRFIIKPIRPFYTNRTVGPKT